MQCSDGLLRGAAALLSSSELLLQVAHEPAVRTAQLTSGTMASMVSVSFHDDEHEHERPDDLHGYLSSMLMFTVAAFCSTCVSLASRLVRSPVRFSSKATCTRSGRGQ